MAEAIEPVGVVDALGEIIVADYGIETVAVLAAGIVIVF